MGGAAAATFTKGALGQGPPTLACEFFYMYAFYKCNKMGNRNALYFNLAHSFAFIQSLKSLKCFKCYCLHTTRVWC